jgi:tetratricopeptide (TPR) repeat protein
VCFAALLALVTVAFAPPPAAGAPGCAADGTARLGLPHAELRERARDAAGSDDLLCAAKALALADVLDRRGMLACTALRRLRSVEGAEADADLLAFEAVLAWHCGQPRRAHEAALAALRRDAEATLAWSQLGTVLAARFRFDGARAAFERALALDPRETTALSAVASLAEDRAERIVLLERFLAAAPDRGELVEAIRGARESIALTRALGDREIFVFERADLPAKLELDPLVVGPGRIQGWTMKVELGEKKRVRVLLDSGAAGLHVSPRTARKAGLEPLAAGTLVGGGGSGEHDIEQGIIGSLDMGPVRYRDVLAVQAADSLHSRGRYHAIMGFDVLPTTRLTLEPDERTLSIDEQDAVRYPGDEESGDPLAIDPWPPRASDAVPLLRVAGMLLVPVSLESDDAAIEVLALLDTGATQTFLDLATAEALGPFQRGVRAQTRGYGGTIQLEGFVRRVTVDIGGVSDRLADVPVFDLGDRARVTGVHVGGFVGLDWITERSLVLDFGEGTVRLLDARDRRGRGRR